MKYKYKALFFYVTSFDEYIVNTNLIDSKQELTIIGIDSQNLITVKIKGVDTYSSFINNSTYTDFVKTIELNTNSNLGVASSGGSSGSCGQG